jgi:hypothetical protein
MMPFMGVRISWDMFAKNSDFVFVRKLGRLRLLVVSLNGFAQADNHLVDLVLQLVHLTGCLHSDGFREVSLHGSVGNVTKRAHLRCQVLCHGVYIGGNLLPAVGDSSPRRPSVPTSRAIFVTSCANCRNWSTMTWIVLFRSRILPLHSALTYCVRSPLATAVVTSAISRT